MVRFLLNKDFGLWIKRHIYYWETKVEILIWPLNQLFFLLFYWEESSLFMCLIFIFFFRISRSPEPPSRSCCPLSAERSKEACWQGIALCNIVPLYFQCWLELECYSKLVHGPFPAERGHCIFLFHKFLHLVKLLWLLEADWENIDF